MTLRSRYRFARSAFECRSCGRMIARDEMYISGVCLLCSLPFPAFSPDNIEWLELYRAELTAAVRRVRGMES